MSFLQRVADFISPRPSRSAWDDPWTALINGIEYPLTLRQTLIGNEEKPDSGFEGVINQAYAGNGVVFACLDVRLKLFSEARFKFRELRSGRPGALFGSAALEPLERPWPKATTSDLLKRTLQYADLAGNAYAVRRAGMVKLLRPDWVTLVYGSPNDPRVRGWDVEAVLLGLVYQPGGPGSGDEPEPYLSEDIAHFAPIPDPLSPFRGMSWLTPIYREILGDRAMIAHKNAFLAHGATPNMVVKLDASIRGDAFDTWVDKFEANHSGAANAYKTLYLGAGADATVVGADMKTLDFKAIQGAGETRIAAAAGVPPVIVGLSEGLQAATYSNYGQARRRFADGTMRPLWRDVAGSFASLVKVPQGSELWYDDRDIAFLQEDMKDAAEIQGTEASTIVKLTTAGFKWKTAVEAVTARDWDRLDHTELFSVQLQPPDPEEPEPQIGAGPPVPPQIPATVPARSAAEVRCANCGKLIARSLGPGSDMDCPRCKTPLTV